MNRLLGIGMMSLVSMTFACGGGEKTTETTSEATPAAPVKEMTLEEKYQDDPIYIKGIAKIKASDCLSCHMVDRKIVGPSYAEVAAKYESTEENITMLAQKVINGGVGVWGEIPMPPHLALTEEDAKDMIRYVLLLKK